MEHSHVSLISPSTISIDTRIRLTIITFNYILISPFIYLPISLVTFSRDNYQSSLILVTCYHYSNLIWTNALQPIIYAFYNIIRYHVRSLNAKIFATVPCAGDHQVVIQTLHLVTISSPRISSRFCYL